MGGTTALGGGSQTVNLTPKAGGGVTATLTAGTAGATSVPLEVSVSSGTLIDWDLDKSEDGGATWSTVEAGITTTTKTASNLNPATSVQFRGTARVEVEAVGTVTVTTEEALYGYEVITMDGYTDDVYTNSAEQSYALAIENTGTGPIYGIRVHGRNTTTSHAQIKGVVLGSGNADAGAMSADEFVQAPFGGANSFTPPDGNGINSPYWLTDDVDFPAAIQPGESGIARLAVSAGNVAYPAMGITASRANSGDLVTGWASSPGDYGSTPANAANSMSWSGGVAVLPFGIVVKRDASAVGPQHAAFGDSIPNGVGNGNVRDRWVWRANSLLTGRRKIVSVARAGYTVQQYCELFRYWLENCPLAELFASCSVSGWSWNNLGDQTAEIIAAVDAAVAAGIAAGKRMSVWFPTPAGLQMSGYGNIPSRAATLAHCLAQGYNVVDTSADVTDADGTSIKPAYTPDGVHLNEAGQDIMGAGIAANQSVIFG